jgi:CheY-like chemotaxis protein
MKFNREVQSKEGRTGLNRVLFNRLTPDHWPRWLAYVFAVELVLVTLLFRLTIGETFFERPLLILFVLPILLSACLGGLGGIIGIVEDGHGTQGRRACPAGKRGALPANKPAETQPFSGHGRVLVMDDDILVREVVGTMLRKLGYEPVFAQEGEEALALYAQGQNTGDTFAAVILDLTIPGGMGGMEAIQHLLAQDPQARALVSSGYADHPIMASYQDYGFQGVIAKPYKLSGLSEVLQKVIVASREGPAED